MELLDFSKDKVQSLDMETLLRTVPENDYMGKPIGGYHHYEVIERILDIIGKYGYKAKVEDMFAAKNNDSKRPGVSILPEREQMYGKGAPESFILRRVYTTITVGDEAEGIRNAIAISYNQNGIQVAFGPNVRICHNQTILSSNCLVSNYRYGNVSKEVTDGTPFFEPYVENWMAGLCCYQGQWQETIQQMQSKEVSLMQVQQFFGALLYHRIGFDNGTREYLDCAPLSCTQINSVVRGYQEIGLKSKTLWDIANLITDVLKPKTADMATMLPCNVRAMQYLKLWGEKL